MKIIQLTIVGLACFCLTLNAQAGFWDKLKGTAGDIINKQQSSDTITSQALSEKEIIQIQKILINILCFEKEKENQEFIFYRKKK